MTNEISPEIIKSVFELVMESFKTSLKDDEIDETLLHNLLSRYINNYNAKIDSNESLLNFAISVTNDFEQELIKKDKLLMNFNKITQKSMFEILFAKENTLEIVNQMSSFLEYNQLDDFSKGLKQIKNDLSYELANFENIISADSMYFSFYTNRKDIEKMFLTEKWVPNTFLSSKMIVDLFNNYNFLSSQEEKSDFFNESMLKIFNNEVIIAFTEKWFKDNSINNDIPLLKTVIERHLNNDYISSIHVIVPRIEGLLASTNNLKGNVDFSKLRKCMNDKKRMTTSKTKVLLLEIAYKFLNKEFLSPFQHGLENSINRNSISHGAYNGKFTELESLKLILFYDLLFEIFN